MTRSLKVAVFVVGSVCLTWISRAALGQRRSHGFYRFLAWETILLALVRNLDVWFSDSLSVRQLVSWSLPCLSLWPVVAGVVALRREGNPSGQHNDPTLVGVEKTIHLVRSGPYRYIRHPLYTSLLLLAWGVLCKRVGLWGLFLALAATLLLWRTARTEEVESEAFFGEAYRSYMRTTKMFIPFLLSVATCGVQFAPA